MEWNEMFLFQVFKQNELKWMNELKIQKQGFDNLFCFSLFLYQFFAIIMNKIRNKYWIQEIAIGKWF